MTNNGLMRFPQLQNHKKDKTFLAFQHTPYAKHNKIFETHARQRGFLTEHTLFFILQGKKRFHFQDHVVTVDQHAVMLVRRGIYTVSEQLAASGCFEALMLFIPETFKPLFQEGSSQNHTARSAATKPYLVIPKTELLKDFQTHYLSLFQRNLSRLEPIVRLRLQEALLLAHVAGGKAAGDFISGCIGIHKPGIEAIVKAHLLEPLSIEDYARLCERSVSTFKRDFQKKFRLPPKQWINEQRLNYAKAAFRNSARNVNEIAQECGFESTSHFIKIFKAHFGHTPTQQWTKNAKD